MKEKLELLLKKSIDVLIDCGVIKVAPTTIKVSNSKSKTHGDFATNIALVLSKQANIEPEKLANKIVANINKSEEINAIKIEKPGFINFFITKDANKLVIKKIINKGSKYGFSNLGKGKKILLEFVSANPTGPLHVGHGRSAAYGATLTNLLRTVGFKVDNEYYLNDAGRQIDILVISVYLRYIKTNKFPDNCYKGKYILKIANEIKDIKKADIFVGACKDLKEDYDKEKYLDSLISNCKQILAKDYTKILDLTITQIVKDIKFDLKELGVNYDNFYSEKSLIESKSNTKIIKNLDKDIYDKDGAKWFNATKYGDEKDRVILRANGLYTYFASDISYHVTKFDRGYDQIIDILGADHHGYTKRIAAAIKALGYDQNKLKFLLVQFANLYKDGKKLVMSTRSGSFVTLKELYQEVGVDATRFFYIMRKSEQHMDFDIDLAKSKTNDNPVFYIQYAHARIYSVLLKAGIKKLKEPDLSLLESKYEESLIRHLNKYNDVLLSAAKQYEPHQLAHYLRELAGYFHSYYSSCEFLIDDENLKNSRLNLITAVRQVIKNGLQILGVSAPNKM